MAALMALIDGMGIYGHFLHYGLVIALVGSTALVFLFLWRKKRLGFEEEAKFYLIDKEDPDERGKNLP